MTVHRTDFNDATLRVGMLDKKGDQFLVADYDDKDFVCLVRLTTTPRRAWSGRWYAQFEIERIYLTRED